MESTGTSIVYVVAGIVAVVGTVLVWRFMPSKDLAPTIVEPTIEIQARESESGMGDLAGVPARIDQ